LRFYKQIKPYYEARKQEEFEEKLKFKNQFRSLDEGELEFLDSIVSEERAEEDAKKKEIESRLDDFRKLQYEADHDSTSIETAAIDEPESTWAVSARRKRKKEVNSAPIGLKLRKLSDGSRRESIGAIGGEPANPDSKSPSTKIATAVIEKQVGDQKIKPSEMVTPSNIIKSPIVTQKTQIMSPVELPYATTGLGGLVSYGSDSDDD